MDAVRQFILKRIADLDLNLAAVSKAMGKNHAYLHQFIYRNTQQELPEKVRKALAAELKVPESALLAPGTEDTGPPPQAGNRISDMHSPNVRSRGGEPMAQSKDGFVPRDIPLPPGSGEMPLYRFAHGGKGAPILEQQAFERVKRPEYLERVRAPYEPYGVMVEGDSMIPEYYPGWIAEVNPSLTPRAGDTCVFRGEQSDGTHWAVIKVLRRETATHWHVEQHHPPPGGKRQFVLKKSEFQVAHVTTGTDKRRR